MFIFADFAHLLFCFILVLGIYVFLSDTNSYYLQVLEKMSNFALQKI